jgi:hypothetical protein
MPTFQTEADNSVKTPTPLNLLPLKLYDLFGGSVQRLRVLKLAAPALLTISIQKG